WRIPPEPPLSARFCVLTARASAKTAALPAKPALSQKLRVPLRAEPAPPPSPVLTDYSSELGDPLLTNRCASLISFCPPAGEDIGVFLSFRGYKNEILSGNLSSRGRPGLGQIVGVLHTVGAFEKSRGQLRFAGVMATLAVP